MKKILLTLVLSVALLIPFKAQAMTTISPDKQSGDISIESNEIIDDNLALAGNNVSVRGTVNGDLFLAGNIIDFDGTVNGNLFVGGNMITINGIVNGDIFVGGNSINLNEKAKIKQDAFLAGNIIYINSDIGRNLSAGTNNLTINSIIGGNVNSAAAQINLGNDTSIKGKLTYSGQQEQTFDNSQLVQGGIVFNQTQTTHQQSNPYLNFNFTSWLIGLLQLIFTGLLLTSFIPNKIDKMANSIKLNFWKTFGIGLLIIIVIPAIFFIFMISLIGLPFAFTLLALYIILIYLVKFPVAYCIGNYIKSDWSKYLKMLVGLVIIQILFAIPFVGFLTKVVILFTGFGSLYLINTNKNKGTK